MNRIVGSYNLFVRALHFIDRFLSDVACLFKSDILYIYSWISYSGSKMLRNNWGDDINIFFLESISKTKLKVKDIRPSLLFKIVPVKAYFCIGSILGNFVAKRYEVWGSGIIERGKKLKSVPNKIHSVRGPLTRQELLGLGIDCPEIYGDPALLVSRYYRKKTDKKYSWGIIPHYMDEDNDILKMFIDRHPEYLLIRMHDYNNWHDIPDQIMQCRQLISSSLHGLIVADSYGVPNTWVVFSDAIKGGTFKYQDYLQSVGRNNVTPIIIKQLQDLEYIIENNISSRAKHIDYKKILDSCPFKDKLIDYSSLIPPLPQYTSQIEKDQHFCDSFWVSSFEELKDILSKFEDNEDGFYFRGVNDASYKLYASSQRHWLQETDRILSLGTTDYYHAINLLIEKTRNSPEVLQYFHNRQYSGNRLFLLAFMQHFGVPSPVIDFTPSLYRALFFSVNGVSPCPKVFTYSLDEYISLYYVDKSIDYLRLPVLNTNDIRKHKDYARLKKSVVEKLTGFEMNDPLIKLLYGFSLDESSQTSGQGLYDFVSAFGADPHMTLSGASPSLLCGYVFPDDSLLSQDGLFFLNYTVDQPLDSRVFSCVNIHKSLIPFLIEDYLGQINRPVIDITEGREMMEMQRVMDLI